MGLGKVLRRKVRKMLAWLIPAFTDARTEEYRDNPNVRQTYYKSKVLPNSDSTARGDRQRGRNTHPQSTKKLLVTSTVKYPSFTTPHSISAPESEVASALNPSSNQRKFIIDTFLHSSHPPEMVEQHSKADYGKVREAIKKVIPREGYDDGSTGPILIRLAWHAAGTYDHATGTGGSNGSTMRYHTEAMDEANKGLECARMFLEPVKMQFPWITYADLWTLAGAVAVEELGGPHIDWKPGRVDYIDEENVPPNGRLPDGGLGQDHLRDVFYRMGFNDQEIVALSGAHNLGRTHYYRSGFDGPWVPNPTQFNNTYFKLLLNEEWKLGKSPAGVEQFYDEDGDMMMLPTDMSLIRDPSFRKWVERYAEDKQLFYDHFAKVFSKLLELGVRRDSNGVAKTNYTGQINNREPAKL